MATVLLTRPLAQSEATAAVLADAGVDAVISPVLAIVSEGAASIDARGTTAAVVTSVHGARLGLPRLTPMPPAVWAVGAKTAAAARACVAVPVFEAGGDARRLAEAVIADPKAAGGPVIYPAGAERKPDLEQALEAAGIAVHPHIVYRAEAAADLSPAAKAALEKGGIDAVLLYSPRSAALLGALAAQAGLSAALARLPAICLSPAVADAAAQATGPTILAAQPNERALLSALGDALGLGSLHSDEPGGTA